MQGETKKQNVNYDFLKKYGAKWAVLAAMEVDLRNKGAAVPLATANELEAARVKISSGCFSSCEAHCDLNKIEGNLVSVGANFGDDYMDGWFDLMGEAMAGSLTQEKIAEIPLLRPIESKCAFLDCACGQKV